MRTTAATSFARKWGIPQLRGLSSTPLPQSKKLRLAGSRGPRETRVGGDRPWPEWYQQGRGRSGREIVPVLASNSRSNDTGGVNECKEATPPRKEDDDEEEEEEGVPAPTGEQVDECMLKMRPL